MEDWGSSESGLLLPRALREAAGDLAETPTGDDPQAEAGHFKALAESYREDYSALRREHDMLGYTVLDYLADQGVQGVEVSIENRRLWAKRARTAWQVDPLIGRACDTLNDFTFGRGVSPPRCRDDEVQKVVEEAWEDPDNERALTKHEAQVALGTDLSLQSNLFMLFFGQDKDERDGKVKVAVLPHDLVRDAVTDPEDPSEQRVLWYVTDFREPREWDFDEDRPKPVNQVRDPTRLKTLYYEHLSNYEAAKDDGDKAPPEPPEAKKGKGRVYHVRINRTSEMIFGVPTVQRILKWAGAYNEFMKARLDMARASAAYIARRQIAGTPNQVMKLAQKAVSNRSALGYSSYEDGGAAKVPPVPGSFLNENERIKTEPFRLDSGAANAEKDGGLMLGQVSAASGLPRHYIGGTTDSALAMAAAMELPVRKLVESRQELFEGLFRAFIDRVIESAVKSGRLTKEREKTEEEQHEVVQAAKRQAALEPDPEKKAALVEAAEQEAEEAVERDLSYEFTMPAPIQRVMGDMVNAVATTARTFDPNNTNLELSKVLLAIMFADVFDQQDPQALIERIYPPGYVDPAVQAAQQAAGTGPDGMPIDGTDPMADLPGMGGSFGGPEMPGAPGMPPGMGGANGGGPGMGPQGEGNAYSVKQKGTTLQQAVYGDAASGWLRLAEAAIAEAERAKAYQPRMPLLDRHGHPFQWGSDLAPVRVRHDVWNADSSFDQIVGTAVREVLGVEES